MLASEARAIAEAKPGKLGPTIASLRTAVRAQIAGSAIAHCVSCGLELDADHWEASAVESVSKELEADGYHAKWSRQEGRLVLTISW